MAEYCLEALWQGDPWIHRMRRTSGLRRTSETASAWVKPALSRIGAYDPWWSDPHMIPCKSLQKQTFGLLHLTTTSCEDLQSNCLNAELLQIWGHMMDKEMSKLMIGSNPYPFQWNDQSISINDILNVSFTLLINQNSFLAQNNISLRKTNLQGFLSKNVLHQRTNSMYQPHVPSLSVRAANVLRLPFECLELNCACKRNVFFSNESWVTMRVVVHQRKRTNSWRTTLHDCVILVETCDCG